MTRQPDLGAAVIRQAVSDQQVPMITPWCSRLAVRAVPWANEDDPNHGTAVVERARRRADRLLAAVPAPQPWSLDDWVDSLELYRGRPIDLVETAYEPGGPVGAWRALPERDLIAYVTNTTLGHQDLIALHEIGHMVCDHRGVCLLNAHARRRVPDLATAALDHLLGRASTAEEELEAEAIATVVLGITVDLSPVEGPAETRAAIRARRVADVFG